MPKRTHKAGGLKTGRPTKTEAERKDDVIRIRVTPEQKALMTATATRLGYDVSAWLRALGLREAQREAPRDVQGKAPREPRRESPQDAAPESS